MKQVGDLEIEQDLGFEERAWRVQRVSWFIMFLVIALALIGLFGTGPLSSARTGSSGDEFSANYERFARHLGNESVVFQIRPHHV